MRGEFVDLGGQRLYYFAAGTRGVGEPVLFLHGFPGTSHLWHRVVPLIPDGHRLIVVDQFGSGWSDGLSGSALRTAATSALSRADTPATDALSRAGTPAAGALLTANAHADRALALLDELRVDHACVVGHGSGAAVALDLALRAPQRVSRLCLINAVTADAWISGAARLARALAHTPFAGHAGAGLLAGLVHGPALRGFADSENGRHALDHFLLPYTQRLGVETLAAQLRAMRDPTLSSQAARLSTLQLPTTIVWGAQDPWLPLRQAATLRTAIPNAELDVVDGARHMTPIDAPERVATAIVALLRRAAPLDGGQKATPHPASPTTNG